MSVGLARSTTQKELANLAPYGGESFTTRSMALTRSPERKYTDYLRDQKSGLLTLKKDLYDERNTVIRNLAPYFKQQCRVERENRNVKNGIQWDPKDIQRINNALLPAHQSNMIARWVNVLMGEQRSGSSIFVAQGINPDDKMLEDMLNFLLAGTMRQNEFHYTEAQIFEDGVVDGRGVSYVGPDPFNPFGKVLIERCHNNQFLHDLETAKNGVLDDCKYIARIYPQDIELAVNQFPVFAEELRRYARDGFSMGVDLEFMLMDPVARQKISERHLSSTHYRRTGMWSSNRQVWMVEFYRRFTKPGFFVWDTYESQEYWYPTEEQAWYKRNMLLEYHWVDSQLTGKPFDQRMVGEPEPGVMPCLGVEVWANDTLLWYEEFDKARPPYQFYMPLYNKGEWRGYFEDDKDHQRWLNRMLLSLEQFSTSIMGKWMINKKALPASMRDDEKIKAMLSRPTDPLILDGFEGLDQRDPDIMNKIMRWYGPGDYGNYPQQIIQYVKEASQFNNGGLNYLGEPAFAGQSGKSVEVLQGRAQTGTVVIFDEMYRWLNRVGEQTAIQVQQLRTARKLSWIDEKDRPVYAPLADTQIADIASMAYNIEIVEKIASLSQRDRRAQGLKQVFERFPDIVQDAVPEIWETLDLPKAHGERIQARIQARLQAEAEGVQQERDLELAKTKATIDTMYQDRDIKREKLRIERNPPMSMTSSINLNPGPEAAAALIEHTTGIPVTAEDMARDMGTAAEFEQAKANLAIKDFRRLVPKDERMSGSGNKVPGKPQSGKDRAQRIRRRNKSQEHSS